MAKRKVIQVELMVDGDSPRAVWHYGVPHYNGHWYFCPIYATAERKCRFIDRVVKAQKMLCRTMEES